MDEDTYISLGTGSAGYISSTPRRKAKNPIGFSVPKKDRIEWRVVDHAKLRGKAKAQAKKRQPKRTSAAKVTRTRVTKSPAGRTTPTRRRRTA